jgi:hypothetical protein
MGFTEKGCPDRVNCEDGTLLGPISTDRPVQLKLQGTYILPWGTSAGVTYQAFNGNLQTSSITYKGVPVQVFGPGDLGRTDFYSNTDLNFSQTFRFKKGTSFTAQFQIINLFDQDFTTAVATGITRSGTANALFLPNDSGTRAAGSFFNGFDANQAVLDRFNCTGFYATVPCTKGANSIPNQLYGMDSSYRGPRSARFYIRFAF